MISFDIVSYCSENYKDAYEFVVGSWIKNSLCNSIFIFTDTDNIKSCDPKVKVIKIFDRSDDWLVGTGRRIDAVKNFAMNNPKCPMFAFLDIDCYIVKPFIEVFQIMENFFDVAVTRMAGRNEMTHGTANAGVWMLKNNQAGLQFINDWQTTAIRYRQEKKGVIPHKVSYAQYSFTKVATDGFDGRKPYKTLIISEKLYNNENQNDIKWIEDISKYKSSVVHFKARRWRQPDLVRKVFNAIKEYQGK